jgi:class 3 adenylate cyclase
MRRERHTRKRVRPAPRAQQELEKRMFHLKTLYDVGREIGPLIDAQAIIENLLLMILGTFGVERGLILLVEIRENRIERTTRRGFAADADAALARAVEAGFPAKLRCISGGVLLSEADDSGLLSALGLLAWVPFDVNERLRGGIGLGEKLMGDPYGPDDAELLVTLANQTAVAVQKATAHAEVVRYANELAASLRRIQILESMKANLAKFVPKTVQALIEESPEAPLLDKREADVSVMFVDIRGYTRLSATMDLERVNQLVEVYFGAFLDEILKLGGDVNETAGDGLMVIFRDSDTRRHATAAVLAALGIQHRTREINATLEGFFEPIAMHVGVNSGIASVGATKIEGVAGTRWTYTASGPTTNIAARLAALGEDGGIVISEETRRRLGDTFAIEEDMGLQALKNVAEPVRAHRLRAEQREPALARAIAECRRHPRRPVSWPVRLWIGDQAFDGHAVDSSIYGIRLVTAARELLRVGASYRVEIFVDGEGSRQYTAEVRNVGEHGVGMETKEPFPLG